MIRSFLALTAFMLTYVSSAQDYAVSRISDAMLKEANAVKRLDETQFDIVSTKETVLRRKWAVTILNEAGSSHAQLAESYDQLQKIVSIEGTLYDASGKAISRIKGKDIKDVSGESSNLYDDSRLKVYDFYHKSYPYTVEYEVVTKFYHTLFLHSWYPQDDQFLSVENASFTVTTPPDITFRFKAFNYPLDPQKTVEAKKNTFTWRVSSVPAVRKPFASPPMRELTPCIILAPDNFEIQGYTGVMKSWDDMGKFQASLNKDRDQLPDAVKQKVLTLTEGLTSDEEKTKALYSFLQQNTRYISIQLGVGGWQPFEASYVATKGYGDCKALSNYMYSLLKAAGIKSHYATVRAGENYEAQTMLEDFPSRQSNHVILCVPLKKDTMWLECTSQIMPAGYMGSFTGNRKALVVTEDGGSLVSTPRYKIQDNLQVRSIDATVAPDGSLAATIHTTYSGLQQDDLYGMINSVTKDKLKEILTEELDLPDYDLEHFEYQQEKGKNPTVQEDLKLNIRSYASVTGKRLFISPNLLNKSHQRLTEEERKFDICFASESLDVDSVQIAIPEGWEIESIPQQLSLKSKFGLYSVQYSFKDNKLFYVRKQEYYAGRFPPTEYASLVSYYADIYKADRSKVVLVKKEGAAVEKKTF